MDTASQPPFSLTVTVKEACAALRMARSKLYYLCDPKSRYYDPTFPKPIRIGKGVVCIDRYVLLLWYSKQASIGSSQSDVIDSHP